MSNKHHLSYTNGPHRRAGAVTILTAEVSDEVAAFYENRRVKLANVRKRKDAREAASRQPVSLAIMPWD